MSNIARTSPQIRPERWKRDGTDYGHEHKNHVRFSQLSAQRQRLVSQMSQMGFGRIEGLRVHQRQPLVVPGACLSAGAAADAGVSARPGAAAWSAPQFRAADFVLKRSVVELMKVLDTVGDGVVDRIELRFGLPVYVRVDGGCSAALN